MSEWKSLLSFFLPCEVLVRFRVFLCFASQKVNSGCFLLLNLSYLKALLLCWVLGWFIDSELKPFEYPLGTRFCFSFPFGLIQVSLFWENFVSYAAWIRECCNTGSTSQVNAILFRSSFKAWIFHDWPNYFFEPCKPWFIPLATKIKFNTSSFHFHALSQTIYPRLAATHRSNDVISTKPNCPESPFLYVSISCSTKWFCFCKPEVTLLEFGKKYLGTAPTLDDFGFGAFDQTWEESFGLALDASTENRRLLSKCWIQLDWSIHPDFIFVQAFWLDRAQRKRLSISIVATIILGQLIKKYLEVNSGMALTHLQTDTYSKLLN